MPPASSVHSSTAGVVSAMIRGAVIPGDVTATVERVKSDLSTAIRAGRIELGHEFYSTLPDRYARRLLCRGENPAFTAVVMTWGPGQGTAVHDHAGIWCVEGVIHGRMDVLQYDLEETAGGRYRFAWRGEIHAGVGQAGCLIPPFEYHVLRNPTEGTSITLHIYGGEMASCHVYHPQPDGWYTRQLRDLAYDNEAAASR